MGGQVCNDFLNGRCFRAQCRYSHEGAPGGGAPPPAYGGGGYGGGGYGGGCARRCRACAARSLPAPA